MVALWKRPMLNAGKNGIIFNIELHFDDCSILLTKASTSKELWTKLMMQDDEYWAGYMLTKRSLFNWNHHMLWKQFPVIGFSLRPFLVTFQPMQAKAEQRLRLIMKRMCPFWGASLPFRHNHKRITSTLAPPLQSFNKTLNLAQAPIIGMPFSSNKVSRARQSCFATPECMCADGPLCISHNSWCHLCAGALKKEIYSLRGFIVTAYWPFSFLPAMCATIVRFRTKILRPKGISENADW